MVTRGSTSAIESIDGITGYGIVPRRAVTFACTIRRDIDNLACSRQVFVLDGTYIRCTTAVAGYDIATVVVIGGGITVDVRRIDARVGCHWRIGDDTTIQRSVAGRRITYVTRRIDEGRIIDIRNIITYKDTLVMTRQTICRQ